MATHTCETGHRGVLADGCERCDEHAAEFPPLGLDDAKMEAMWAEMVRVEIGDDAYATANDKRVGSALYRLALFLERQFAANPWVPLPELRQALRG